MDLGVNKVIGSCLADTLVLESRIDGGEVRLLNDDEILGTVDNPEDILTIL